MWPKIGRLLRKSHADRSQFDGWLEINRTQDAINSVGNLLVLLALVDVRQREYNPWVARVRIVIPQLD